MTITNGYATLEEYKAFQRISSTDTSDDLYIESALEAASRWIDRESSTRFYTATETRYYNTPYDIYGILSFDQYYTAITSITNGDGQVITNYVNLPANTVPIWGVRLKENSNTYWLPDANSNALNAIKVIGDVGYSTIAPKDIFIACLEIAKAMYSRRFGENMSMSTVITNAGVVQIPEGVPAWAAQVIGYYKRAGIA